MRLHKRRPTGLVGGPLVLALALFGVLGTSTAAQASTTRNYQVTFNGFQDNSPAGDAIAYPKSDGYPTIHDVAGGTGTFADPVTFASDQEELPIGAIVYYPALHRYLVNEDDCTQCDEDWTGQGLRHISVWIDGENGKPSRVTRCEDDLTQDSDQVITNPPGNEPVDTTPLFDSSTNTCYDPSGFTG